MKPMFFSRQFRTQGPLTGKHRAVAMLMGGPLFGLGIETIGPGLPSGPTLPGLPSSGAVVLPVNLVSHPVALSPSLPASLGPAPSTSLPAMIQPASIAVATPKATAVQVSAPASMATVTSMAAVGVKAPTGASVSQGTGASAGAGAATGYSLLNIGAGSGAKGTGASAGAGAAASARGQEVSEQARSDAAEHRIDAQTWEDLRRGGYGDEDGGGGGGGDYIPAVQDERAKQVKEATTDVQLQVAVSKTPAQLLADRRKRVVKKAAVVGGVGALIYLLFF